MVGLPESLQQVHDDLVAFIEQSKDPGIEETLRHLEDVANRIGRAWSGSWLGFHASVYYNRFSPPPPGAHFSQEWGLMDAFNQGSTGEWREYPSDDVYKMIFSEAGNPDLTRARETARAAYLLFEEKREELLSIFETALSPRRDLFIERLRDEAVKEKAFSASDFVSFNRPSGNFLSRDQVAISQGFCTPPHIVVLAETFGIRSPFLACEKLARLAARGAAHIARVQQQAGQCRRVGGTVFIGHGQSPIWRQFKDFVQDRLQLPWDEFNRVPVAGITNIARLSEMLNSAAIAFLIMTAEDEQADGRLQARMNVVHEAGLFQGRLGFARAIILLEEGCEEFSNIQGLGQIRFPKGNIQVCFEEVRRVLEREELIDSRPAGGAHGQT